MQSLDPSAASWHRHRQPESSGATAAEKDGTLPAKPAEIISHRQNFYSAPRCRNDYRR